MLSNNQPKNVNFFSSGHNHILCPVCGMDVRLVCASYGTLLHETNINETSKPPPVCSHLLFITSVEGLMYISHEFKKFLEKCGIKPEMKWSPEGMGVGNIYKGKTMVDFVIENHDLLNGLSGMSIYFSSMPDGDLNGFPYNSYTQYGFKKPN